MKFYKGYSPKYSSSYLFYLVPAHTQFMHSQGFGYHKSEWGIAIRRVKLFRAEDSLTPIRIPNETV